MNLTQNGWLAAVVIAMVAVFAFAVGLVSFQLLASSLDTGTTSSVSGLEIITSNGREELSIVRGTSANEDQVIKRLSTGLIGWADDATATLTGAGAVALDIGNDGDDSTGLIRIITDNDTNGIAAESPANTLLFDFSNNYPVADSATTAIALAANGANCIANQFNKGVDASGAAETCAALVDADVPDSITITLAATATALAANPADCAASNFANAIAANGDLTCIQVNFTDLAGTATDAQIPDTITITLAATATALAANGSNCSASQAPLGVDEFGAVEGCTDYEEELVDSAGLAAALSDETGTGLAVFNSSPTLTATVTITGAGTTFTLNLDCTANTNGGALTADAAGLVTCSDDDGGAGAGDINDVGDCSSGSCFTADGTGTTLWMEGATADAFEQILATADMTGDATFTFPNAEMIDDQLFVATGAGVFEYRSLADCQNVDSNHLNYNTTGNVFSCGSTALGDLTDVTLTSPLDQQHLAYNGAVWINQYSLDLFKEVRNESGSTINKGDLVYVSGFNVGQDLILVSLADADGAGTSPALGMVWDTSIANNANGFIIIYGRIDDLDTSACSLNDGIFLDTTPGAFTCTRPTGTTDIQRLGIVLRSHATQGRLEFAAGRINDLPQIADDNVWLGSSTSVPTATEVTDCTDTGGNHLNYTQSSNAFSCGNSSSVTDTGPLPDCVGTTTYQDGEGNCDTLDGLEDFETPTSDGVVIGNGSTFDTAVVPDCQGTFQATTYITGSNSFGCNTFLAGRSLTESSGTISADSELFTGKKSIVIINPTTSETNLVQFEYGTATTITEISCSTNTGTVTIQFDERARATPNSAGTDVMSATLTCDTDTETTTGFDNAGIAADVPLNLQITATASTPGVVRIHVKMTKDD